MDSMDMEIRHLIFGAIPTYHGRDVHIQCGFKILGSEFNSCQEYMRKHGYALDEINSANTLGMMLLVFRKI